MLGYNWNPQANNRGASGGEIPRFSNGKMTKRVTHHEGVLMRKAFKLRLTPLAWTLFGLNLCLAMGGPSISQAIPAFPGAEGFGARSVGGRGGKILFVTNLNDSGTGSLRTALKTAGPRIVVFRVGGLITLLSDVWINEPFLTVAGQTAPGDGVCIRGGALRIETHDVIMRGLRIRPGDLLDAARKENGDGITVENPDVEPYNIIIDHCSISWTTDENMATWYACRDITFQWCIVSEALHWQKDPETGDWDSGYGILIGPGGRRISIHHNLIAHHQDRSPLVQDGTETEVINNTIYNWIWYATRSWGKTNVIGNQYITGPSWSGGKSVAVTEEGTDSEVYVKSNIGPARETNSGDEWLIGTVYSEIQKSLLPAIEGSGITTTQVENVTSLVSTHAGAIWPKRDPVDNRVLQSIASRSGALIASQRDVGGWPAYASAPAPTDTDSDGMPDFWESANGLNPNNASDALLDGDGDGFQNIEEYINGLIPGLSYQTTLYPPANLRVAE